jgi:hypothetical protein
MNFEPITLKSGTVLPIMNLKGKKYLEVKYRLVWFREEHPDWGITTDIHHLNDEQCVFRATITTAGGQIIAQATKSETLRGFSDYIEKAETGAIGRALALCGYGTQFEPELEEGERIVDAPIESKSSIASATKAKGNYATSAKTTSAKNSTKSQGYNASQGMARESSATGKTIEYGIHSERDGAGIIPNNITGNKQYSSAETGTGNIWNNAGDDKSDPESFSNRPAPTAPFGGGVYSGDTRGTDEPRWIDRGNAVEVRGEAPRVLDDSKQIFGNQATAGQLLENGSNGSNGSKGSGWSGTGSAPIANRNNDAPETQLDSEFDYEVLLSIGGAKNLAELMQVWNKYKKEVIKLPPSRMNALIMEKEERKKQLS